MAPPGSTPTGPRELTGIVDLTPRGGVIPPARCWTWSQAGLAPCTRTGLKSAAKTSAPVSRSRHWTPSKDIKNAIDDQLQDATSVLDAFHIVKLAGDALDEVRLASSKTRTGHPRAQGDPLYQIRNPFARLA